MGDKWTHEKVADHFEEAIQTLKRLPPVKVKGYFNVWPEVVHTPNELMFQEAFPIRLRAAPDAISRLEQTFEWMTWIEVEERTVRRSLPASTSACLSCITERGLPAYGLKPPFLTAQCACTPRFCG